MPFASNRKYATTSIIPFNAVPTIPNNQFFEAIAKIMPSNERIPSIEIIKVKFALGPLRIKKICLRETLDTRIQKIYT